MNIAQVLDPLCILFFVTDYRRAVLKVRKGTITLKLVPFKKASKIVLENVNLEEQPRFNGGRTANSGAPAI